MNPIVRKIKGLIDEELSTVSDQSVVRHVRDLLVEPTPVQRHWDYDGAESHVCWTVLEEKDAPLGIAYSEFGFGPECPWGLVRLTGTEAAMAMGMDCEWYPNFLDPYFDSAASELPIWRVFKPREGTPFPGEPIGPITDWDSAWADQRRLLEKDPPGRYTVHHSIAYGRAH